MHKIRKFRDKETNVTRLGTQVGKHLIVCTLFDGSYIYTLRNGILLVHTSFANETSAIKVAEWIDQIYGEYLDVHSIEYPDFFRLCMWSVRDGIRMFELVQTLPQKATLENVARNYRNVSATQISYWTRNLAC